MQEQRVLVTGAAGLIGRAAAPLLRAAGATVVPFDLNPDWNLITRVILPVVGQSDVLPGTGSQSGLGDTVASLFFSPKRPTAGGWICVATSEALVVS